MSLTRPRNPARVAIVAGVVLIGINVAIWGGRSQVNGPAAVQRPVDVVDLFPAEGQLVLPQGTVGAQLRTDFTGQLTIDGQLIPQDQLSGDADLGQYVFDPGPDKEFRELAKGRHGAVIEWWPRGISTPEEARAQQKLASYSWTFNVG
jgi:hypothetical protein